MRRVLAAAAVLACALGLAACNDDDSTGSGSGLPQLGSGGATGTDGSSGSGKTGTPLAGTDPCALLKPADVPELYQAETWTATSHGTTCAGYDYSVNIDDDVTPDTYDMYFHGADVKALPDLAGHKAAMEEVDSAGLKHCNIVIEVTADELVHLSVAHSEDPSQACDIAKKAAAVVAGRLPA